MVNPSDRNERYLFAAARYVEMNPVRAGLATRPWRWRWSSASAHRRGKDDALVTVRPLLELAQDWEDFLSVAPTEGEVKSLRLHERTGRPLGSPAFVERVEQTLQRLLRPAKRGPKPHRKGKRHQPRN